MKLGGRGKGLRFFVREYAAVYIHIIEIVYYRNCIELVLTCSDLKRWVKREARHTCMTLHGIEKCCFLYECASRHIVYIFCFFCDPLNASHIASRLQSFFTGKSVDLGDTTAPPVLYSRYVDPIAVTVRVRFRQHIMYSTYIAHGM